MQRWLTAHIPFCDSLCHHFSCVTWDRTNWLSIRIRVVFFLDKENSKPNHKKLTSYCIKTQQGGHTYSKPFSVYNNF